MLAPGAAQSQVPGLPPILNPPPEGEPPSTPGRPPPALPHALPDAEASEVAIDAARTNHSLDDTLIPPLERRWKRKFDSDVRDVLIGDRTVFVRLGNNRVLALAGRSGRTLWAKSPPGSGASAISYEAGRLVVLSGDGTISALDGSTGRVLWQRPALFPRTFARPIATVSGVAVVVGDDVHALNLADGSTRWTRDVDTGSDGQGPVIDDGRVFVACATRALSLSTGQLLWSALGCDSARSVAGGGYVTGEDRKVRSAATGATMGRYAGSLQILAPAGPVFQDGIFTPLTAHRGLLGPAIWRTGSQSHVCHSFACSRVVGAGANLYSVQRGRVAVRDLATGRPRWRGGPVIGNGGYSIEPEPVAGDGLLVVRENRDLTGYASVLNPRPTSLQDGTFDAQTTLGGRARLFGALGRALRARGPADVTLQQDTFPFRRFRSVKKTRTSGDGGFGFRVRPKRNTRYRSLGAVKRSSGGTVFVYPRYKERVRRGRGRQINKLRSTISVRVPRGVRLRGRRVHLYLVRVARRRVQRLGGGAGLRSTGRGRARGTIRFNALRGLRRRDYFFFCIRGMSRQGMGPRDVIDRRCGRKRLPF